MFLRAAVLVIATVAILVLIVKLWIGLWNLPGRSNTDFAVVIAVTFVGLWILLRAWAPLRNRK
jgi:hypothetical protein